MAQHISSLLRAAGLTGHSEEAICAYMVHAVFLDQGLTLVGAGSGAFKVAKSVEEGRARLPLQEVGPDGWDATHPQYDFCYGSSTRGALQVRMVALEGHLHVDAAFVPPGVHGNPFLFWFSGICEVN